MDEKKQKEEMVMYDKIINDGQYKNIFLIVMQIHKNQVKGTDLFDHIQNQIKI